MTKPTLDHSALCEIAKKWLLRPNSQRGHGCNVALSECRSGWVGEMPDAIGYRAATITTDTVLVEAKTSRADFLADAKKPHRADGEGIGLYRYYMCPEGLIQPEEVPARWGLLWVTPRGRIIPKLGPVALSNNCGTFDALAEPWRHTRNTDRETWLLVRVLARIDDPDKVKKTINTALREQARLAEIVNIQAQQIQDLQRPKPSANFGADSANQLLTAIRRKTNRDTPSPPAIQPSKLGAGMDQENRLPDNTPAKDLSMSSTQIQPIQVQRDPNGYFLHPAFPGWDQGTSHEDIRQWFSVRGLEHAVVCMEDQLSAEESEARLKADLYDAEGWEPKPPDDGEWFVLSIHCSDDGPCCIMAKTVSPNVNQVA